jgi:hypothetical protein
MMVSHGVQHQNHVSLLLKTLITDPLIDEADEMNLAEAARLLAPPVSHELMRYVIVTVLSHTRVTGCYVRANLDVAC